MSVIQKRKIILASRSPARRAILLDAGFKLGRFYSDIDESWKRGEPVARYAVRVAFLKAKKCAGKFKRKASAPVVIGVDTVIAHRGRLLGKPRNRSEAKRFLKELSGKWHKVYTGTSVIDTRNGRVLKSLVVSRVKFTRLKPGQIDWYVGTGEPLLAAGAYSIQGKGRALVEAIDGCFTNVIGISIPSVKRMLERLDAI